MSDADLHQDEPLRDDNQRLNTADLADAREPAESGRVEERAFDDSGAARGSSAESPAPLYSTEEAKRLHDEWAAVQTSFVDEPRQAVEQADHLVAVALKHLAETFSRERASLEGQWDRGDDVSTEDLRLVLRKYRSFFDRLLSI